MDHCMRDGFEQGKLLDGRFITLAPLNHGSFGMVFTAKDITTGDDVAVKCMTKPGVALEDSNCPAAIAIDDRSEELQIHSKLGTHPNIVNLIHHFETEHHQYMVLELCSNGDLYEAIRLGRGPLETKHVRDFMLQLVGAVDFLHANGVYHRDIKPENIFLTATGSMKLGDFGLATTDMWSTEFAVGSDRYMAPEQFDASVYGYGYSPASADVWAIGIVLLNVLFQRNPFAQPTPKDPLFADFVRDRQSLFDVFPNMSQDTYNVLAHSLALDPANRSLAAVREALKTVVSFTTDEEALDDFCTGDQADSMPMATAAREPLRTPSVTTPNVPGEYFPWTSALMKTPPKATATRQLSTIRDEESELYPGSVQSEWQYVDADEASLSSNHDSGLGMSYKSSKSTASKPISQFVGSLPISFTRPASKGTTPYGTSGKGFSKSWSDLWDEDEEMNSQAQPESRHSSFEDGRMDMERVSTAKPAPPPLTAIREEDRGSVTPRQGLAEIDANTRMPTASPLRQLIEEDKKHEPSPKQRSSSILDKWATLGNFRRAKVEPSPPPAPAAPAPVTATTPTSQKTKYADAFASLTPFTSSKKQKSRPATSRDRAGSWRPGSPTRLRSTSVNNSRVWERKEKEHSPNAHAHAHAPGGASWSRDNNWRQHMSPMASKTSAEASSPPPVPPLPPSLYHGSHARGGAPPHHQPVKSFLDTEFEDDIGDLEWVGGWRDFHL